MNIRLYEIIVFLSNLLRVLQSLVKLVVALHFVYFRQYEMHWLLEVLQFLQDHHVFSRQSLLRLYTEQDQVDTDSITEVLFEHSVPLFFQFDWSRRASKPGTVYQHAHGFLLTPVPCQVEVQLIRLTLGPGYVGDLFTTRALIRRVQRVDQRRLTRVAAAHQQDLSAVWVLVIEFIIVLPQSSDVLSNGHKIILFDQLEPLLLLPTRVLDEVIGT